MLLFFDFLYYSLYKFYAKTKKSSAESSAAAIIGGLQAINVLALLMILALIFNSKIYISNKLVILVLALLFQVCTYIRYLQIEKHSVTNLEVHWNQISDSQKKRYQVIFKIYLVFSLVLVLSLAIYLGSI